VCPAGEGCAYTSIQAAINDAATGGTVTVGPGSYTGAAHFSDDVTVIGVAGGANTALVHDGAVSSALRITNPVNVVWKGISVRVADNGVSRAALVNTVGAELTLEDVWISGTDPSSPLVSTLAGVGIRAKYGSVTLRDVAIHHLQTTTANAGAAIDLSEGASLDGEWVWLHHNSGNEGAAINTDGSTVALRRAFLNDNSVSNDGGAIRAWNGSLVNIDDAQFKDNSADAEGGCISLLDSTLTANHVTFGGCYTGDWGGGIFAQNASATLHDASFRDNMSHGGGAAISTYGADISVARTVFLGNTTEPDGTGSTAASGGAIHFHPAEQLGRVLHVEDSKFGANHNYSGYSGGAINADGTIGSGGVTGTVLIERSAFIANSATYGAGIETGRLLAFDVYESYFCGNDAHSSPAGIAGSDGIGADTYSVTGSIFADNHADWAAALEFTGAQSVITDNLFVNNSSDQWGSAEAIWADDTTMDYRNNILSMDPPGEAESLQATGTSISPNYNHWYEGTTIDPTRRLGGDLTAADLGGYSVSGDPDFIGYPSSSGRCDEHLFRPGDTSPSWRNGDFNISLDIGPFVEFATTIHDDIDGDGYSGMFDCNEGTVDVSPAAEEICDGIDNDCDRQVDDLDTDVDWPIWYRDDDGDGFGRAYVGTERIHRQCTGGFGIQWPGYVESIDQLDCDDTDPDAYPGAPETDFGVDSNCDGSTVVDPIVDNDGDGWEVPEDCDDFDPDTYPGAFEQCDGIDNDCDSSTAELGVAVQWYGDVDGDGYGDPFSISSPTCNKPIGYVINNDDCNDSSADINPGQPEVPYDTLNNDCDLGTPDDDLDRDGLLFADDCDDTIPLPGPLEVYYDGLDNDCSASTVDDDQDADGFVLDDDCDDTDGEVHPGASEVYYDGVDNDCDASTDDTDQDADGYAQGEDCDDLNVEVNPGASEIYYNGVNDDCDEGTVDNDQDGDGSPRAVDCDDEDARRAPNFEEVAYDGIDNDCKPATPDDDLDADGFVEALDCDDQDAAVHGPDEIYYNGLDDDCDESTDDADQDGDGTPVGLDCDDENAELIGADEGDGWSMDEDCRRTHVVVSGLKGGGGCGCDGSGGTGLLPLWLILPFVRRRR